MRNPYLEWTSTHIQTKEHLDHMIQTFHMHQPTLGGFDTETTGLHIKKDTPFLIPFGWAIPHTERGVVYTFDPTPENMNAFFKLANQLTYNVGHNVKYDCHMLSNIGYAEHVQRMTNLCENMVLARLTLEAVPARDGGDSLALKKLGEKYVHPFATRSESLIHDELENLNKENVKYLSAALKQFPYFGQVTKTGKPQMWNKGLIEKFLKNPTHDLEDLPDDVRDVWEEWQTECPAPTYANVDRDLMIKYGAEDIITMLEFAKKSFVTLTERKQHDVLKRENDAILPLYRMERVGIKTDPIYLADSRKRVKAYIIQLRGELTTLMGEEVTCNQHDRIKQLFHENWAIPLAVSDKQALKQLIAKVDGTPKRVAILINKLRTLEKWYSTYILRVITNSSYDGRAYTQINQASAVSGRVGSDFQQFPKDALLDLEGNELYHPRRPFVPTGNGYDQLFYLDYSQVELRVAAHYTILVSGGDLNLCRAYFPFKLSPTQAKNWKPTDIHAETTKKAYPHIKEGTDEFASLRGKKGKPTNFLCLYGGTPKALKDTLDVPLEEAQALYDGYNQAFPHLAIYSKAVERQHLKKGYVTNMLGRRYYLKNRKMAYKLGNYLIQGTCADALKEAITRIDRFLQEHKYHTRFQMNIHDELSFEVWNGEEHVIPKLLKLMEQFGSWCQVPIVADVEVTTTNWAEKHTYTINNEQ